MSNTNSSSSIEFGRLLRRTSSQRRPIRNSLLFTLFTNYLLLPTATAHLLLFINYSFSLPTNNYPLQTNYFLLLLPLLTYYFSLPTTLYKLITNYFLLLLSLITYYFSLITNYSFSLPTTNYPLKTAFTILSFPNISFLNSISLKLYSLSNAIISFPRY